MSSDHALCDRALDVMRGEAKALKNERDVALMALRKVHMRVCGDDKDRDIKSANALCNDVFVRMETLARKANALRDEIYDPK